MKKRLSIIMISIIFIILIVSLFVVVQLNYNITEIGNEEVNAGKLPVVNTKEKLISLLNKYNQYYMTDDLANSAEFGKAIMSPTAPNTDYSNTNIQVQGVDEADLVKTDGKYIYSISQNRLLITDTTVEGNNIVTTLFKDEKVNPIEMMLDGKHLTVICRKVEYNTYDGTKDMRSIMPYYNSNVTIVNVYDISDVKNVVKLKTVEMDGNYLTSRKVGNSVYVITNKYVVNNESVDIRPMYKIDNVEKIIDYDKIFYFPGTNCSTYTMIGVIDLSNASINADVTSYLSSAQNVYMSLENLYITAITGINNRTFIRDDEYMSSTSIYKFSIKNDKIEFIARAELKGTTLNQFSMDEYNGYFRVTLNNSKDNSLYVLDKNMNVIGKITGIAQGEKIYSTRFIKDRAYVVTFKTVDPLFVIDLKDPINPKILGELKIPGYSSYLHEYDENHIIGIGQDTTEVYDKDKTGKIINTRYIINGMKMAIFDVTDVNNPVQQFSMKIGNKNTYSDVLYNHKSFLFSKEKNLLAFPIDVYGSDVSIQTGDTRSEVLLPNSTNRFQGLIVYNIDLKNGFTEKGRITHYDEKNKNYSYDYLNNIKRGIYINDILYTVSESKIKANDLNSLKELYSLNLK